MGAGRTYASAARYPGVFVSSGFIPEASDDIEGFVRARFRLLGVTEISSSASVLVEPVTVFDKPVGGRFETGRLWSSTETMDKSSPFHWSPRWWSF